MKSFCLQCSAFCLSLAAGAPLFCATAATQPHPNRPVRIVVPQAAGIYQSQ